MSTQQDRVQPKLQALDDKDANSIVEQQTYIPFTGVAKDVATITEWIDKRRQILLTIQSFSEAEINDLIKVSIAGLCQDCKNFVSIPRKGHNLCAKDYDKVCTIILYQFAIGQR